MLVLFCLILYAGTPHPEGIAMGFAPQDEPANTSNTVQQHLVPVADVETSAIEYRKQIHSGELQIDFEYSQSGNVTSATGSYLIWFDGNRSRVDQTVHRPSENFRYGDQRVITGEAVYYHNTATRQVDDTPLGMAIYHKRGAPELYTTKSHEAFDPRALGMAPTNMFTLHAFSMDSYITRADRTHLSANDTTHKTMAASEVAIGLANGDTLRAVIVPSWGNSVVELEYLGSHPQGPYIDRLSVTVGRFNDIWFPEVLEYEREFQGRIIETEKSVVKVMSLNQPVDDTFFSLAGMNLPVGIGVLDHPPDPKGSRYWNGHTLVYRVSEPDLIASQIGDKQKRRNKILLLANLALVGAFCVWYAMRKRGTPNESI
jgi:hypothetical protein